MNENRFVDSNLEKLLNNPRIKSIVDSSPQAQILRDKGKYFLERAYKEYARDYFETHLASRYLASALRTGGSVADLIGTYAFWALGGMGFVSKTVGVGAKTAADILDENRFRKTKLPLTADLSVVGEGLVERAVAYLPLGVGELAGLYRGRRKFDDKVKAYAFSKAEKEMIDYLAGTQSPRIIKLSDFRNPYYAGLEQKAEAA